jgi:hypothetical protein
VTAKQGGAHSTWDSEVGGSQHVDWLHCETLLPQTSEFTGTHTKLTGIIYSKGTRKPRLLGESGNYITMH